ncbi:MAG TPA: 2-oxo-4-hydroxy-4-carboxy-5-ureidoimidazoline decarboxylase [Candidatus Marinimicrobia bacterium]|nr:2-oxo-4-hydroxy-4-carboxy-5-ureidoimidazoline decarboxylase [Candidatus Neomarinimicrobiota bacterium]
MTVESLNSLTKSEAFVQFEMCCGASNWVEKMSANRPFQNDDELFKKAESIWFSLSSEDWLEAFTHHPKIGDIDSLRKKSQNTKSWSEKEQLSIQGADEVILEDLAESNRLYKDRFGFIFIICATGKSAEEMFALLKERLKNDPEAELLTAAKEQNKITQLRLGNLLSL